MIGILLIIRRQLHIDGLVQDCSNSSELANKNDICHYDDVIMTMLASQITSLPVVCSIVYSDINQRKHQSSASLAFVREIHRGPVNFPNKWPVTRKMFPFDDVIMHFSETGRYTKVLICQIQGNADMSHFYNCQLTIYDTDTLTSYLTLFVAQIQRIPVINHHDLCCFQKTHSVWFEFFIFGSH